jgi:hypothetical protein
MRIPHSHAVYELARPFTGKGGDAVGISYSLQSKSSLISEYLLKGSNGIPQRGMLRI